MEIGSDFQKFLRSIAISRDQLDALPISLTAAYVVANAAMSRLYVFAFGHTHDKNEEPVDLQFQVLDCSTRQKHRVKFNYEDRSVVEIKEP
jgi:hypothetical protein